MVKKILKKSYLFIGLFILVWLIKDIDLQQFKKYFLEVNVFYFILAIILYLPNTILKSYRWKKIMDTQHIYYSLKNSFLMYGASSLLGLVTPGKIGDFSKIIYLKKDNYPVSRAFLGNFLDKLFDLFFVLIFSITALLFFPFLPSLLTINYLILIKWTGLIILLVSVAGLFFFIKNKANPYNFIAEIMGDIKKFKTKNVLLIFMLTIAQWLIYFVLIYLIAASVDMHKSVSFFYLSFSAAMTILVGLLPISILNIGTREATFIFFLSPLGVSKEKVILFSILVLLNYLSLFFIYLYCWIKKPFIN